MIQRYNLVPHFSCDPMNGEMEEADNGEYVLFEDHQVETIRLLQTLGLASEVLEAAGKLVAVWGEKGHGAYGELAKAYKKWEERQ